MAKSSKGKILGAHIKSFKGHQGKFLNFGGPPTPCYFIRNSVTKKVLVSIVLERNAVSLNFDLIFKLL